MGLLLEQEWPQVWLKRKQHIYVVPIFKNQKLITEHNSNILIKNRKMITVQNIN